MAPTLLSTWQLNPGPSVQIVGRQPWPQRVLLHDIGAGNIFVSDSGGAGIGQRTIQVPGNGPTVIVLAPNQDLYAAADAVGGILSVAASAAIPRGRSRPMGLSSFDEQPSGQVLDISDLPRRVTAALPPAVSGRIGTQANVAGGVAVFTMVPATLYTFVIAPGQALYGLITAGLGQFSIHASDLVPGVPRGPTGIPGPDGQE